MDCVLNVFSQESSGDKLRESCSWNKLNGQLEGSGIIGEFLNGGECKVIQASSGGIAGTKFGTVRTLELEMIWTYEKDAKT